MVKRIRSAALCGLCAVLSGAGCEKPSLAGPGGSAGGPMASLNDSNPGANMKDELVRTDAEWKRQLTPDQYRVLREKGTELAFTGAYWNHHEPGAYRCAGCGQELFESETKFDSGCGWPSFSAPAATNRIETQLDDSLFMHRTEVLCSRCGGHLGHVFEDGPKPTGLRYCINSASLKFAPKGEEKAEEPATPGPATRHPGRNPE